MLKELKNGYTEIATDAEVAAFVAEARKTMVTRGWKSRRVTIWGYEETYSDVIDSIAEFPRCDLNRKQTLIAIANSMIPELNAWAALELLGKHIDSDIWSGAVDGETAAELRKALIAIRLGLINIEHADYEF